MSLNPNNKIGVKILSDEQLKDVFCSKELFDKKIDEIRKTAKTANKMRKEEKTDNFNLMFDNIISILGDRGTGKTSVLSTLYDDLKKDKTYNDIIVPMIVPELLNEQDTLIGWILTSLEETVKNYEALEKEITEKEKIFELCSLNRKQTLREQYNNLKAEYAVLLHNRKNIVGYTYSEELRIDENRVYVSYNFMKHLCEFWDTLVCLMRKSSNDENKEPLMFIFIDDSDLAPQILIELMYILPKYMSHPNVVVFVAASPKIMHTALKNRLYSTMLSDNLPINSGYYLDNIDVFERRTSNKVPLINKDYKTIDTLTTDILLKAFSPANRFHLHSYKTLERKMNLLISIDKDDETLSFLSKDENKTEYPIKELFAAFIEKIYNMFGIDNKNNCTQRFKEKIPEMYFSFLGNTVREISNVYFALKTLVNQLSIFSNNSINKRNLSNNINYNEIYVILRAFIQAVIDSNPQFRCFCSKLDKLLLKEYAKKKLYINYAEINNVFFTGSHFQENRTKNINIFLAMYALLNFVEHIIVMIIPDINSTRGYAELEELFDRCRYEHLVVFKQDLYDIFVSLEELYAQDLINKFDADNLTHQNIFLRIAVKDLGINIERTRPRRRYSSLIEEKILERVHYDPEWGNLLFNILFTYFSGSWVFDKFSLEDFELIPGIYSDKYFFEAVQALRVSIHEIIMTNDDYIRWAGEKSRHILFNDKENNKWDDILDEIMLRKYDDSVIELSEINNILNEEYNANSDEIISEWIIARVPYINIKDAFEYLKKIIYSYISVSVNNYSLKKNLTFKSMLLIDTGDFWSNILELQDVTNFMDKAISEFIDKTENLGDRVLFSIEAFEEFYKKIYNSLTGIRDRKNSLKVMEVYSHLTNICNNCRRCLYDGVDYIKAAVDYLMALKAIVYIHDKYIASVLNGVIMSDRIHNMLPELEDMRKIYNNLMIGHTNSLELKNKLEIIAEERKREIYNTVIENHDIEDFDDE